MPEIRTILALVAKISFVVLISILMILWIVQGVENNNHISDSDSQAKKFQPNPQDRGRTGQAAYDKQNFDRMKGMNIFDTILEEVIAILVIVGVILNQRYILHTSMTLMAIIWFIAHYRISDVIWFGSQVTIASHVFHFLVVCFGLIYAYFVKEADHSKDKSLTAKVFNGNTNTTTTNTTTKAA